MNGPYPYILKQRVLSDKGHLSNELSGTYLKELIGDRTKKIVLAHLSEINNTPEVALKTVKEIVDNKDIEIINAFQDEPIDVGEV
jgi:phosphoribosyl 1,2-cyclic phosphodiesterase